MGSTLIWWIALFCVAFVVAIVTGLRYPFIPRHYKDKLKKFEVERGYDGEVRYKCNPTVRIIARYSLKVNCIFTAIFVFAAWVVFVLGGALDGFLMSTISDASLWPTFVMAFLLMLLHIIFWFILLVISMAFAAIRISVLKKDYEYRAAKVGLSEKVARIDSYFN